MFAQVPLGHVTKFLPVQHDGALAGFIKAKEQVHKRALPRPGLAHESHRLSGGDVEGEMVKDGASLVVAKGHIMEIDVPLYPAQGNRMRRVLDGRLGIHDFLEPLESRHAPLVHLRQDGQAEDRLHEDIHIEQERHEIGQEQRPFVNHPPAGEDHHHIDEVRKEIDAPGEIGDELIRSETSIAELLTFRRETGQLEVFFREGFHQADTREALLHPRAHLPRFLSILTESGFHLLIDLHGVNAFRYQKGADDEGQLPIHHHHHHQSPRHDDAAKEHVIGPAERQFADFRHIAGDAGEQLPGLFVVVVVERQFLHVGEKIPPHVMLDGRAHHVAVVLHRVMNSKAQKVQTKQPRRLDEKPLHVPLRQHVADDFLHHHRKYQIQPRHGKGPHDDPYQDAQVGTVIFHKSPEHISSIYPRNCFLIALSYELGARSPACDSGHGKR